MLSTSDVSILFPVPVPACLIIFLQEVVEYEFATIFNHSDAHKNQASQKWGNRLSIWHSSTEIGRDHLDIIHHWPLTQHPALDHRDGYCVSPSAPRWYQTQLFLTHPHYVRSSATWIMKLSHVFLGIAQQWVGGGLCSPSEIFVVQVVHQGNDLVMTLSAHDHLQKKQIMVWQRS